MGWGALRGLGQGLLGLSAVPQQYLDNRLRQDEADRRNRLTDEQIQSEALQRTLMQGRIDLLPTEKEQMLAGIDAQRAGIRRDDAFVSSQQQDDNLKWLESIAGTRPDETAIGRANAAGLGSRLQNGMVSIDPLTAARIEAEHAQAKTAGANAAAAMAGVAVDRERLADAQRARRMALFDVSKDPLLAGMSRAYDNATTTTQRQLAGQMQSAQVAAYHRNIQLALALGQITQAEAAQAEAAIQSLQQGMPAGPGGGSLEQKLDALIAAKAGAK